MCWKCRLIEKNYKKHGWDNLIEQEHNILDLIFVIVDEISEPVFKPFRFLRGLVYYKYHKK